jgi:ABC-type spermidine/putrescine transport system permease subunit II
MYGTEEWIVGLWLFPVTVFILIPLSMLIMWSLAKTLGFLVKFFREKIAA